MKPLPCPPEHWTRFSALLDDALDLPEAARGTWLSELAGEDAAIKPWLARVLTGAPAAFTLPPAAREATFRPGSLVGPYRLENLLGEGGMGEVWRASRHDEGPQREVALKLPHAELLGAPFRQRFTRERDLLAALTHTNIAQLYDAGLSEDGHPYLALELVQGEPITEACLAANIPLERRLDLICQVLDALSYAHRRLIVHRDIKPSNVLVTPEGRAKLLDFGIAKLLNPDDAPDAGLTQPMARLATPAYAAPEQIAGGAITVAADLFSVGALLFELLTGERPFVRVPAHADAPPARPASQVAARGGQAVPARRLRGDLDAVIAQALALDPAQRYVSAEAFALDLRRCQAGMPVSARRIGWPTRATKFARRNRLGVALAAAILLSLFGGTAGIAWQAERAARQAARATEIKDYLLGLFKQADPRTDSGEPSPNRTAKQLLDTAAGAADTAFAGDPDTEIDLLGSLGSIYELMEDMDHAEGLGARRLALMRGRYGPQDPRTLLAATDLANTYSFFVEPDKAHAVLASIRGAIASSGANSLVRAEFLYAQSNAARSEHGGRAQAIADATAAIKIFAADFPENPDYGVVLQVLAGYRYDAEEYQAAIDLLGQAEQFEKRTGAFSTSEAASIGKATADAYSRLGNVAEADRRYLETAALAERTTGRRSFNYLASVLDRGVMHIRLGDRALGNALFEQGLAAGADPTTTGEAGVALSRRYGIMLAAEGDAQVAIPRLEAGLAEARRNTLDENTVRNTEEALGDADDQVGRSADARLLLRAARDEFIASEAPLSMDALGARERWGRFLLDHGDEAAALQEFRAVLAAAPGKLPAAAAASAGLARIALAAGDLSQANTLSAQAIDILEAIRLRHDVRIGVDIWCVRADVLRAEGQSGQARMWAQKAVTAAQLWDSPASARLARARAMLGRL